MTRILFPIILMFTFYSTFAAPIACPKGKSAYETSSWSMCCEGSSRSADCAREGIAISWHEKNMRKYREINYTQNRRNGAYLEFDYKGKKILSGQFKNDIPVGDWVLKIDNSPTYKLNYNNGKLFSITVLDKAGAIETSSIKEYTSVPLKPVIGLIHPSYDVATKTYNDLKTGHTLLHSDPELKNMAGIAVDYEGKKHRGLHYRFLPNEIFNSKLGEYHWGNSASWPVHDHVNNACQVAITGQFEENRTVSYKSVYLWTACSSFKDIVEHFKENLVGISKSEVFFKKPKGKKFRPNLPKGILLIDEITGEEIDDSIYMVDILESRKVNNELWVRVSLSLGETKNFDEAWVPFHNGSTPRLKIFTE